MSSRRELVQLAEVYDATKHRISGWLASAKLDGTRMFWDGGLSRGVPTIEVPWAGIHHPKTLQLKDKIKPTATGLWSRYGNPILAPDWFLDKLPATPLDGEGWCGPGTFQLGRSIIAGDEPDRRWNRVQFMVYGCPAWETMTRPGLIKNASLYREIDDSALQWVLNKISLLKGNYRFLKSDVTFSEELTALQEVLDGNEVAQVHVQRLLPTVEREAVHALNTMLKNIVSGGGEGVMVRSPNARYDVKRVKTLLKVKPENDDEGMLAGFTAGKGKYSGMIGALVLDFKGKRLELSGMTDDERQFIKTHGDLTPGKDVSPYCLAKSFKRGQQISFKFRELSDEGIPKEARYFRIHEAA